jgi:hypothetical protein
MSLYFALKNSLDCIFALQSVYALPPFLVSSCAPRIFVVFARAFLSYAAGDWEYQPGVTIGQGSVKMCDVGHT